MRSSRPDRLITTGTLCSGVLTEGFTERVGVSVARWSVGGDPWKDPGLCGTMIAVMIPIVEV
jgi:hypothetical protein